MKIIRSGSIENGGISSTMDSSLWRRLPEDCIDRVLARLPLPSMFRLRTVCKRWNSFISSEAYFSLQSEISANRACFLLCTHGKVSCIFNFALDDWHYIPVPRIILPITVAPVSVTSASGSLLCYANQVAECSTLFVYNPFTKSMSELPPMKRVRLVHKLSIIATSSSPMCTSPSSRSSQSRTSYKIMVSGEDGAAAGQMLNPHVYKLYTEVYDSATGLWEMAGCPLPDANFGSDPGVWLGTDVFYCVTELPYGVVVFDLKNKSWSMLKADMPHLVGCPSLVTCSRNRLLMVGRELANPAAADQVCRRKLEDPPKILKVWELSHGGNSWVEIHRLPDEFSGEFFQPLKPRTPLVCSGVGNLVCITTHLSSRAIVLDISTSSWKWLPQDPLFPHERNFHLLGFCFEPNLEPTERQRDFEILEEEILTKLRTPCRGGLIDFHELEAR